MEVHNFMPDQQIWKYYTTRALLCDIYLCVSVECLHTYSPVNLHKSEIRYFITNYW